MGMGAEQLPTATETKKRVPRGPPAVDEASVKKLYTLLDRSGKRQVSRRDVLVALKKQPPIRRLFGLPVAPNEEGGAELEKRLLAIQDAFEGGSTLGELEAVFDALKSAAMSQEDAAAAGSAQAPTVSL